MDAITRFVLSFQNEFLFSIALLLENLLFFTLIIAAIIILSEKRNNKRLKIVLSLAVITLLAVLFKLVVHVPRPCIYAPDIPCPMGDSFPSLHAGIVFTLMIAFLNKKSYPLFLVFALFVSFTRLQLGVHTFIDIAGALPLAIISYYITDILWKRWGLEKGN